MRPDPVAVAPQALEASCFSFPHWKRSTHFSCGQVDDYTGDFGMYNPMAGDPGLDMYHLADATVPPTHDSQGGLFSRWFRRGSVPVAQPMRSEPQQREVGAFWASRSLFGLWSSRDYVPCAKHYVTAMVFGLRSLRDHIHIRVAHVFATQLPIVRAFF